MVLRRRPTDGDQLVEEAVDLCVRLEELLETLTGLEEQASTVLTGDDLTAARAAAEVARAQDAAKDRFLALTRQFPPGTRKAGRAEVQYTEAVADLAAAVQAVQDGVTALTGWVTLPQRVKDLQAAANVSLNMARQACTAAAHAGLDTTGWDGRVTLAVAQLGKAGERARARQLARAVDSLTRVVADLDAVAAAASTQPGGAGGSLAGRARVQARMDTIRALGAAAISAATDPASRALLGECGAHFHAAVAAADADPDAALASLDSAERLLEQILDGPASATPVSVPEPPEDAGSTDPDPVTPSAEPAAPHSPALPATARTPAAAAGDMGTGTDSAADPGPVADPVAARRRLDELIRQVQAGA